MQVHVIGQHDAPVRLGSHVLGGAAGRRHAERAEGEAQVLASATAEPTGAAWQRRVDGDPVTDAHLAGLDSGGDDSAGHLVTRHHGEHAMIAGEDVQVGAAEPDGGDLDDDVVGPGRGVVDRRDLDRAWCCHHDSPHADLQSSKELGVPDLRGAGEAGLLVRAACRGVAGVATGGDNGEIEAARPHLFEGQLGQR